MTDKVWFPRVILVLVPTISNLVSLVITSLLLLAGMGAVGAPFTWRLVMLPVGMVFMFAFTVSFSLVTSSLNVYFRDVRFIVQAGILMWFYLTPIIYPIAKLHSLGTLLDFNPMVGIIGLFQFAAANPGAPMLRPLISSGIFTVVFLVIGAQASRKHARLFVDKL